MKENVSFKAFINFEKYPLVRKLGHSSVPKKATAGIYNIHLGNL